MVNGEMSDFNVLNKEEEFCHIFLFSADAMSIVFLHNSLVLISRKKEKKGSIISVFCIFCTSPLCFYVLIH